MKNKKEIIINKLMIRNGLPKINYKGGHVNCVLALWKDDNYCDSNLYLPKWQIVNAQYYNSSPQEYEGYIYLEDINPPNVKKCRCKTKEKK